MGMAQVVAACGSAIKSTFFADFFPFFVSLFFIFLLIPLFFPYTTECKTTCVSMHFSKPMIRLLFSLSLTLILLIWATCHFLFFVKKYNSCFLLRCAVMCIVNKFLFFLEKKVAALKEFFLLLLHVTGTLHESRHFNMKNEHSHRFSGEKNIIILLSFLLIHTFFFLFLLL